MHGAVPRRPGDGALRRVDGAAVQPVRRAVLDPRCADTGGEVPMRGNSISAQGRRLELAGEVMRGAPGRNPLGGDDQRAGRDDAAL